MNLATEIANREADDELRRIMQPKCDVIMGAMHLPEILRNICYDCGSEGARHIDYRIGGAGLQRIECRVCGAIRILQRTRYDKSGCSAVVEYEYRPSGSVYEAYKKKCEEHARDMKNRYDQYVRNEERSKLPFMQRIFS